MANERKNFALIGAAGYIAPRHMKAIIDTDNRLVAALDKSDSVGILDNFSYNVAFFTEFERFDRHAEKLRRQGEASQLHYISICSPNYLHDAHIRFALRIGAHAICEKPLVLNPWNLDALAELEQESGRHIYNILQLRVHPALKALRERVIGGSRERRQQVELTYITSRGNWYFHSWKGDAQKSGGVVTNIGIHFFDMLMWVFGPAQSFEVHLSDYKRMAGYLELANADVRWFLSVANDDLPAPVRAAGKSTYRSVSVDGQEIEFSEGFVHLHTEVYRDILAGGGYGVDQARPSIELVHRLRQAQAVEISSDKCHTLTIAHRHQRG
jgi:UDP-N-acetyl-2-amino-2-deoxyglucuronate dehydrogenase